MQQKFRPFAVVIAAAVGMFMVTLDTTAANVALGNIRTDLAADLAKLQWVVDGYQVVFASLLLAAGALGDRIGNKGVFLSGMAVFILASALCAVAPSADLLILARLGQGVGAALLVPASLSVVRHAFHEDSRRARAVSVWAATSALALVSGPLVGGWLVDRFSWRSIFWLNIPVGILGFAMASKSIRKSAPDPADKLPLNLAAQAVGIVALAAAAFVLIEGPDHAGAGWTSPAVLAAIIVGALCFPAFLLLELRHANPIVPRHLWSHTQFVTVVCVGFFTNFTYYGLIFLLSLYFEQSRHFAPGKIGEAFLPMTVSVFFANLASGKLSAAFGPRPAILIGQSLCISALALFPFLAPQSLTGLGILMLLIGLGSGLIIPAITAGTLDSVPPKAAGIAAGILQTSRQIGGVFGVAVLGAALAISHNFPRAFLTVTATGGTFALLGFGLVLAFVKRRSAIPPPT